MKYREKRKENERKKIPEEMKGFESLSIFNEEKFERIESGEEEILCISKDLELSEDEKSVLRMHTKFSVIQYLKESDIEFEQELAYAKVRMERRKEMEKLKKEKLLEGAEYKIQEPTRLACPGPTELASKQGLEVGVGILHPEGTTLASISE